jgi:hypothetical protein
VTEELADLSDTKNGCEVSRAGDRNFTRRDNALISGIACDAGEDILGRGEDEHVISAVHVSRDRRLLRNQRLPASRWAVAEEQEGVLTAELVRKREQVV